MEELGTSILLYSVVLNRSTNAELSTNANLRATTLLSLGIKAMSVTLGLLTFPAHKRSFNSRSCTPNARPLWLSARRSATKVNIKLKLHDQRRCGGNCIANSIPF